jgi:hypothetical protein
MSRSHRAGDLDPVKLEDVKISQTRVSGRKIEIPSS